MICLYRTFNTHWGKEDGKHTWFLKERCRTGSSAAREMLLSKMKNRIRLVKMLSLTIRWQWTRNLQERGEAQLYLSENSQTWETLTPPLLPAGLAPEDCSSEQLPFAPAAGRTMGPGSCAWPWLLGSLGSPHHALMMHKKWSAACRTQAWCIWMANSHSLLTEPFVI